MRRALEQQSRPIGPSDAQTGRRLLGALACARSRELNRPRSVREAMERYLRSIKRKELERKLEEGYSANSGISEQIHKEFDFVDAEQANDGEWYCTR